MLGLKRPISDDPLSSDTHDGSSGLSGISSFGTWLMRRIGVAGWAAGALAVSLVCGRQADAQQPLPRLTQYGHTTWLVQNGEFSSPNAIAQTADGYLWLATDAGLVRFDGVRFVPAVNLPNMALSARRAQAVHAAADGSLWFALGNRVIRQKGGQVKTFTTAGLVSQFAEDDEGVLWAAMQRTAGRIAPLCRFANDQMDCLPPDGVFPTDASSLQIAKGGIWIGGTKGLCHWSREKPTTCHLQDVLKQRDGLTGVASILTSRNGTQWIGIGQAGRGLGLGQFAGGEWRPFSMVGLNGSTLAVSSLLEDRDGAVWVGTSDQGLFRIHGGRAEHFGRSDGLSSTSIRPGGLFQDREGTVWVLTGSGLDSFRRLPVSVFSAREGLPADAVESVLAAKDGTVWFGNQSLSMLVDNEHSNPPKPELFKGKEVTSMLEDHAGKVWIGLNNTLNIFEQGRLVPVPNLDGGPLGTVRIMTEDIERDVWVVPVGVPPSVLLRIRDGKVVQQIRTSELVPGGLTIYALAPDPNGGLLLGLSNGGIGSLRNGSFEMVSVGVVNDAILRNLHVESDGTVMGATLKGLLVKRGEFQAMLNMERGLPCETLRAVVRDRRRDLWLRSDCGLMVIAADELERWMGNPNSKVQARLFDQTEGARPGVASFTPLVSTGPDGRLWFATSKFAQVVDPAAVATRRPAPHVLIEEITADRAVIEPAIALKLPARTRDLEIRYTATSFIAPQKVRFRYWLEGRDRDWTEAGTRREAFYTDLPPGEYRFRVIASNADGVWSDTGAAQTFEIPPLFYQTKWFMAMCIGGTAAALYALYFFRLRQAASRLSERIAAKNAERERIARELHDTLLQSTEGLILQLHVASRSLPEASPVRQALTKALDRADAVVAEGRDRVLDLRTSEGAIETLPQALASVGQELVRNTVVDFRTTIEGRSRTLDRTVLDEVYRIGREALLNAHRHAAARQIELQLIYGDADFRMRVRDDGVGIDLSAGDEGERQGHWGLQGMRERAQRIGAEFDIWSRPGAGTEIEVRIPATLAYARTSPRRRWLSTLRLAGM